MRHTLRALNAPAKVTSPVPPWQQASHSPILGWGAILNRTLSRPVPVLLHQLMPNPKGPNVPYRITGVDCGNRHVAFITEEGHFIMMGGNRHGQVGQPSGNDRHDENLPYFYDLEFNDDERPNAVSCGTNSNIFYRKGTKRAVVIGNNTYGQLCAGHKDALNNLEGFGEWNEHTPWFKNEEGNIKEIVSGNLHTILMMDNEKLFVCGSNMRGELGLGTLSSPMVPTELTFFKERGIKIKKIRAGCSFTLFLTEEGKVYGCGNWSCGQVEKDDKLVPRVQRVSRDPIRTGAKVNLVRIKDIGCTADMSVFVSYKNEVFVRGSITEFGFETPPAVLQQVRLPDNLKNIVRVETSGTNVYLIGEDGAVFGFGANTEGQLVKSPGRVNLSPAFIIDEAVQVLPAPEPLDGASFDPATIPMVFGEGFGLLVDDVGRYAVSGDKPVQFPQPIPTKSKKGRMSALLGRR